MDAVTSAHSFRRRRELDGLRGVLVLLVVAYHLRVPFFSQGYCGVDAFFVLSGFVISSLLIREQFHSPSHSVRLLRFYSRRVGRLLPSSLVVVAASTIAFRLAGSDKLMDQMEGSLLSGTCFMENVYLIFKLSDLTFNPEDSPVMHFWALAVEEQFYAVFPLVFGALLSFMKFHVNLALWMAGASMILVVYQKSLTLQAGESLLYFGTQFRLYQLLAGASLGVVFFHYEGFHWSKQARMAGHILAPLGMITILGVATPWFATTSLLVGVIATIGAAMMIVGFELDDSSVLAKLLRTGVPQLLGALSYTLYLWHYPVIVFSRLIISEDLEIFGLLAAIFVLSWLTRTLVEVPVKTRCRDIAHDKVLLSGLLGILLTASLITFLTPAVPVEQASSFPLFQASEQPLPQSHVPEASQPAGLGAQAQPPASMEPTHFWLGDSFAGEWEWAIPVIEQNLHITFRMDWKEACPWFDVGRLYCPSPDSWMQLVTHYAGPKVAFCVQFSLYQGSKPVYDKDARGKPVILNPGDAGYAPFIEKNMIEALDRLLYKEKFDRVVLITPHFPRPPALDNCLLLPEPCDGPYPVVPLGSIPRYALADGVITGIFDRIMQRYQSTRRLFRLNIDHILAPNGTVSLRDAQGTSMWQNSEHLNQQWAREHAMDLADALAPYLILPDE